MIQKKNKFDVIIVGAGPAGITAAIYAVRASLKPLILTDEILGGKVLKTLLIENFPSFKTGSGADLAAKFLKQVEYQKTKIIYEKVIKIDQIKKNTIFEVTTLKQKFEAPYVILATGSRERKFPLAGVEKFMSRGISYCASCDGYFYKNKPVAVIGGGNAAVEESKVLAKICSKVYLINRNKNFSAEKSLVKNILNKKNVTIFLENNVTKFLGKTNLRGLEITNSVGKKIKLAVDGLFIFIGSIPNNMLVNSQWKILDENGYINTNSSFETSIPRLYAIGDIVAGNLQQYTTAMGSATIAITEIITKF